jgi:hypothetical protein
MTKDEALDLALEALDIVKIHFTQNRHVNDAITAIKQARSAPVQEPVAVIGSGFQLLYCREDWAKGLKIGDKLYTTPPAAQRQWVGLTDKEIDQGLCRTPYAMKTAEAWREGVRWAYHQLKEKNT